MRKRGVGKKKKNKSSLTEEDQDLWEHTTESVTPMHRANTDRVHPKATNPRELAGNTPDKTTPARSTAPPPPSKSHTTARVSKTPPMADFDPKAARRIRSGRIAIEARLDLHGMRQSEAHDELRRFLISAQANGRRWVLVITGKGGHRRDDDDAGGYRRTGVLKHSVPQWLSDPELRMVVVSYRTAASHHGGEGALYIQLRSNKRHPSR